MEGNPPIANGFWVRASKTFDIVESFQIYVRKWSAFLQDVAKVCLAGAPKLVAFCFLTLVPKTHKLDFKKGARPEPENEIVVSSKQSFALHPLN